MSSNFAYVFLHHSNSSFLFRNNKLTLLRHHRLRLLYRPKKFCSWDQVFVYKFSKLKLAMTHNMVPHHLKT